MTARRTARDWQAGDFATFPDRFGRARTGIYTGETTVQTTRRTAAGEEVPRKVPVTFASMLTDPAGRADHPGSGAGSVSVDVRKLRPASPAEIAASPVRQGWAVCQQRAAAAAAWWEAAGPAVVHLMGAGYAEQGGMGMTIVNLLLEADRFPGIYAYTADREHWVVKHMPGERWSAGAAHPDDPALRAARAGAR
jgi:hypothetical protein